MFYSCKSDFLIISLLSLSPSSLMNEKKQNNSLLIDVVFLHTNNFFNTVLVLIVGL